MGAYIDALLYIKGKKGKQEAALIVQTFLGHLNEADIGSVSEIFDGEFPHTPRGCIAQAWGVGELLRIAVQHELLLPPKKESKNQSLSQVL